MARQGKLVTPYCRSCGAADGGVMDHDEWAWLGGFASGLIAAAVFTAVGHAVWVLFL